MNTIGKIMACLGITVLFFVPLASIESIVVDVQTDVALVNTGALDGGWLEECNGVKILHVSGTDYEMGYQHGHLLSDEIHANMRMMFDFFADAGFSYDTLAAYWNDMQKYIPESYILEIQGVANGCNASFEEIGVLNIMHDISNIMQDGGDLTSCCGAIVWGSATTDGELIHLRSGDLTIHLRDAETGTYLQENQALIVRRPENRYASMSPVWVGMVGSGGGINEKGIAVGETTCLTDDITLHGTCAVFRMGLVLDQADSGVEALDILETNRTMGWDLLVSDANIPQGYILEQTANASQVCTWNDASEATEPFWIIEDVLRRANCFIHPEMAPLEREYYDVSGIRSALRLVTGRDPYFGIWKHYVALSKGIENNWGAMDINTTMEMYREVYQGKTDIIFSLMMKIDWYMPIHQWVARPKTGDMAICFASQDKIASYNPVHYFNLFKLLEAEPP